MRVLDQTAVLVRGEREDRRAVADGVDFEPQLELVFVEGALVIGGLGLLCESGGLLGWREEEVLVGLWVGRLFSLLSAFSFPFAVLRPIPSRIHTLLPIHLRTLLHPLHRLLTLTHIPPRLQIRHLDINMLAKPKQRCHLLQIPLPLTKVLPVNIVLREKLIIVQVVFC